MINVTKRTSRNKICQPVYISTQGFVCFLYSMHYLVLFYGYWLKATNSDTYQKIPNRSNSIFSKGKLQLL